MAVRYRVKVSQYFDSVSLMEAARDAQALPGIEDAALVMGTKANKRLLAQAGPLTPTVEAASPNDLILMGKGDEEALERALAHIEARLTQPGAVVAASARRPRTLRGAVRAHPASNLAVISVAGAYAAAEAWAALRQGLHVLLFSDNVPLADEIELKRYAVANGRLLMGPGAGTAIINGAALGFANVVPSGPVGLVSAAGTGLQEVSSLLARQGVGVSQGIGVGGRDLSDEVGGQMMLHALAALQADLDTKVIVAISKLPSPAVVEKVLAALAEGDKPAVIIFMGAEEAALPPEYAGRLYAATTLQEAALAAAALAQGQEAATVRPRLAARADELRRQAQALARRLGPEQKYLRGLFSGGTLCEEAMRLWSREVGDVWSNEPLKPEFKLPDSSQSREHCALDLGAEEFTLGRPHPMIDNDLRIRRLLQEARVPQTAVLQLDVVLGYGAHPDPAGELAPAISQARALAAEAGRELLVVTALTGAEGDPQSLSRQAAALAEAGALVEASNAEASQLAAFIAAAGSRS